jgi:hypothetical protein
MLSNPRIVVGSVVGYHMLYPSNFSSVWSSLQLAGFFLLARFLLASFLLARILLARILLARILVARVLL